MNTVILVTVLIAAIVVGGWIIDSSGLNDLLLRQGPMRGVMHQYLRESTLPILPHGLSRGAAMR
jgi:hypothetical protein